MFLNVHAEDIDLFQFHKGTIKTTAIVGKHARYKLFQFHKGTIKTDNYRFNVSLC